MGKRYDPAFMQRAARASSAAGPTGLQWRRPLKSMG